MLVEGGSTVSVYRAVRRQTPSRLVWDNQRSTSSSQKTTRNACEKYDSLNVLISTLETPEEVMNHRARSRSDERLPYIASTGPTSICPHVRFLRTTAPRHLFASKRKIYFYLTTGIFKVPHPTILIDEDDEDDAYGYLC